MTCFQAKALYDYGMGPASWLQARNKYLSSAAEMGYAPAQYALAYYCYYSGSGGPRDDVQAVKYFTLAADQNYSEAVFMLGYMHYNGRGGLLRDLQKAKEILSRPALKNHAHAKRILADIEHSEQERQHALEVVESTRKAADGGDAKAQLKMARYYKSGTNVVHRDSGKGLEYLRLSAEQGLPAAQLLLGRSYDNALFDLKEDCAVALEWYRKAANRLDPSIVTELNARREVLRYIGRPSSPLSRGGNLQSPSL
jgi:TPR repeat protein